MRPRRRVKESRSHSMRLYQTGSSTCALAPLLIDTPVSTDASAHANLRDSGSIPAGEVQDALVSCSMGARSVKKGDARVVMAQGPRAVRFSSDALQTTSGTGIASRTPSLYSECVDQIEGPLDDDWTTSAVTPAQAHNHFPGKKDRPSLSFDWPVYCR